MQINEFSILFFFSTISPASGANKAALNGCTYFKYTEMAF